MDVCNIFVLIRYEMRHRHLDAWMQMVPVCVLVCREGYSECWHKGKERACVYIQWCRLPLQPREVLLTYVDNRGCNLKPGKSFKINALSSHCVTNNMYWLHLFCVWGQVGIRKEPESSLYNPHWHRISPCLMYLSEQPLGRGSPTVLSWQVGDLNALVIYLRSNRVGQGVELQSQALALITSPWFSLWKWRLLNLCMESGELQGVTAAGAIINSAANKLCQESQWFLLLFAKKDAWMARVARGCVFLEERGVETASVDVPASSPSPCWWLARCLPGCGCWGCSRSHCSIESHHLHHHWPSRALLVCAAVK